MKLWTVLAKLGLIWALSNVPALSGTNGFFVPFFRGSSNSQAGYWESFQVASGTPGNSADGAAATTSAVLTQSDTNAIITGSGNIYNVSGVSSFTLTDSTPFTVGTVVVQVRSLGAEVDPRSVVLTCTNASGRQALAPGRRIELARGSQPGLGATVALLWQWDLSGLGVNAYSISFRAGGASLSFDAMTLDTSSQAAPLFGEQISLSEAVPSIERWMYPHNAAPCDRPAGSVFGTLAHDSGVDTRHAQQLLGWDTATLVATNRGSANYLVKRCRVTLTINRGNLFQYDPTQDDFRTFFATNHAGFVADVDAGRSIELFGVGFRNGYTAATFEQCAPFGGSGIGQRNAFAAGWSTNGSLVDVSNSVGKTNEAYQPFEVAPFAVGRTTNALPGELVPAGATITFDLNLADPLVLGYLHEALNEGRLRLMVTWLHGTGGQLGAPQYPDFVTHFNQAALNPSALELEGTVIGPGDVDNDSVPDDWEIFYFDSLTHKRTDDPDADGAANVAEFHAGTNPASSGSVARLFVERQGGGEFELRFGAGTGRRCTLEFSESLDGWNELTNAPIFELSTGVMTWRDHSPSALKRFYRVRAE